MNIVHVVEAWKGGIASYVQSLIRAQLADGHQVFLFADEVQFQSDARDIGVKIVFYQTSRNPLRFFKIAKELQGKISPLNADVVHCHSTFPGVYCRFFKNKSKTRLIYTPHGWSFFKKDVGFFGRKVYGYVEKLLSSRCDNVMCMSFEEVEAARKIGILDEKLRMIHTGILNIPMHEQKLRKDLEKVRVGFFGRFDYQKGYDYLEKSVPYLSTNVELHFFGGAVRGDFKAINANNVINHGWVQHDEMHNWMLEMDAIISPSRWEGFSLTILEAMRAGKALIISDKSSLPETVISGYNGIILYDLSPEGLAASLNALSVDECLEMGQNSREIFEQCFAFEEFYRKVHALYLGK